MAIFATDAPYQAWLLEWAPVNRALTTWLLLAGMLLQSVGWMMPFQRAEAAERLAHKVLHVLDRGEHGAGDLGHDVDLSLIPESDRPQPGHSHANEGVQLQGLPVSGPAIMPPLPALAPQSGTPLAPPPVLLDGLLRPPCATA